MKIHKLSIGLTSLALFFSACHSNSYKIEGTTEGMSDGDTLFIVDAFGNPTDTLTISNGKFEYEGEVDSAALYLLGAPASMNSVSFFKEPGTIKIHFSADGNSKVSGTKANDGLQIFEDINTEYAKKAEELMMTAKPDEMTEAQQMAIFQQYKNLQKEMLDKILELASDNIDNEFGYYLVVNIPINEEALTPEKASELIEKMPEKFKKRQLIKELRERISAYQDLAVGKEIKDFTLTTPDGAPLSIMSEVSKHKITVLDFWASWCNPCRREMPNIVKLYKDYQPKGLGIIGISLDEDADEWKKAIKSMGLTWPQVSDLKGWQSEPAKRFQVRAIPFTIVLDNNGKIIAKELRGVELENFIKKQLN